MKKIVYLLGLVLLFSACGTTSSTLYNWGNVSGGATQYEENFYRQYKKQSAEATCAMLVLYEQLVSNPGGTRSVPPPGLCAEYAYMLILPETAETFAATASNAQKKVFASENYAVLFQQRAEEMFKKEMELYPESVKFLEPLVKRLTR